MWLSLIYIGISRSIPANAQSRCIPSACLHWRDENFSTQNTEMTPEEIKL